MKKLQDVLTRYEENKQKVITSLELNQKAVANKLLEEYKDLTYTSILDNTTKAQVSFSKNAKNLLEIEGKETKELKNLQTIKNILLQENDILEDKSIILEETMIQKQQHLLNLNNLNEKTTEEKNRLKKVYTNIKREWEDQNEKLDKTINNWKQNRENKLKQEEESILYEHNQKFQEIKDKNIESLEIITKDFETKERLKYKDISIQRKELDENSKTYDKAKEYIENFDASVSEKVSKQSGMKLGFLKKEHENSIKIETNNFINELDILELDLENKTHSCEAKNSLIEELKEKLTNAKSELNNLTQNTLTVQGQ